MVDLKEVFNIKSKIRDYSLFEYPNSLDLKDLFNAYKVVFVDDNIKQIIEQPNAIRITSSEGTKSWENLDDLIDIFIFYKISKSDKVLIIGGGVLQDAVSFCCSVYARGVEYDYIPSTLLSMIDSCVGAKTSINFKGNKNKIGNFWPPGRIILDSRLVESLDQLQILSGLGELFKFCLLNNELNFFTEFWNNGKIITNDLIIKFLLFKKSIVEIDEFDIKERLLLNYGHTFGHALESNSDYKIPHGIAVVIGICIENRISAFRRNDSPDFLFEIEEYASKFTTDVNLFKDWFDFGSLKPYILNDKKNANGLVAMVDMDLSKRFFQLYKLSIDELEVTYNCVVNDVYRMLARK
jgi:3-dehydroquinate synthase